MNQNKLIPVVSITVIVIVTVISGYVIMSPGKQTSNAGVLAPIVDGKQAVNMTVLAVGYSPSSFKVKAGVPVRWEITSSGQPGCASGMIIANGLVDPIYLNPEQGQVTVAEFTPQKAGMYRFSCSMNMARGSIEVVN